jgi:hypothetical protein
VLPRAEGFRSKYAHGSRAVDTNAAPRLLPPPSSPPGTTVGPNIATFKAKAPLHWRKPARQPGERSGGETPNCSGRPVAGRGAGTSQHDVMTDGHGEGVEGTWAPCCGVGQNSHPRAYATHGPRPRPTDANLVRLGTSSYTI